ncbi:MAG: protein-L-isoaspartate(D-aspartate) O-methyltransferase, partial [Burkholderiales bacterium]
AACAGARMARALSAASSGIGMTSERTRARMVARLRAKGIADERVLDAMATVPRHLFVDSALASRAYEDTALPIGFGQTISQPYVVARMIELLLAGRSPSRALEVGTGCGYQAAVLARIFPQVYSIERIKALLERARRNLLALRLPNLRLTHGDGYAGLDAAAPFHSVIVAAAAPRVPEALAQQLVPGGRMILPLADPAGGQRLLLIERTARGSLTQSELDPVRFVPMEVGKA